MLPEAQEAAMATDFSRERDTERPEISEKAETQEALGSRLEGLVQQMQTPAAKGATEAAFDASPNELGRAAVEQARPRRALAGAGVKFPRS